LLIDSFVLQSDPCSSNDTCSTTIRLSDTINDANEYALEENALKKAQTLLLKLESTEDLIHDTATVLLCLPVRTQSMYVQNVHRLERTLCRSEGLNVSPSQIAISRALITRYDVTFYNCIIYCIIYFLNTHHFDLKNC
jgi:hypothetical protein